MSPKGLGFKGLGFKGLGFRGSACCGMVGICVAGCGGACAAPGPSSFELWSKLLKWRLYKGLLRVEGLGC